jgi:hypothetical protein
MVSLSFSMVTFLLSPFSLILFSSTEVPFLFFSAFPSLHSTQSSYQQYLVVTQNKAELNPRRADSSTLGELLSP